MSNLVLVLNIVWEVVLFNEAVEFVREAASFMTNILRLVCYFVVIEDIGDAAGST